MKLTGSILFALGIAGLAVLGIISNDFIISRPPAWNWEGRTWLPLIINALILVLCVAIMLNKMTDRAAIAIGIIIIVINFFGRHIPAMMKMDLQTLLIGSSFKAILLFGGCLVIAVAYRNKPASEPLLLFIATCFAIFFIISGRNHFKYHDFVSNYIPGYLPFHNFFTYFCGVALIAGAIGLFIKPIRATAALLCAIMILGWFLLLHLPRFIQHSNDASDQMGLFESLAFGGALLVMYTVFKSKKLSS